LQPRAVECEPAGLAGLTAQCSQAPTGTGVDQALLAHHGQGHAAQFDELLAARHCGGHAGGLDFAAQVDVAHHLALAQRRGRLVRWDHVRRHERR
jgi:hypothetical protein